MVNVKKIVFITAFTSSFLLYGSGDPLDTSVETAISNLKETVIAQDNSPELFDLLLSEAKSYYIEAMIADHFNDTSEVKYYVDRTLEIVSQLSQLDSLSLLQQDDFDRFFEKMNSDQAAKFHYLNGDSGSYKPASIREEISEDYLDSVPLYKDTLRIVEDRAGHLPIVTSAKVERVISYFQTKEKKRFQQWLDNSGLYKELMTPILKAKGLPEEIFYLALIESGYNPKAYSYAHAGGTWQFISSTGAKYGLTRNWWIDERYDPIKATYAAAEFLSDLYEYFDDWYLALAAYNCGQAGVMRAVRREGTRDYWKLQSLPKQTRNYVPTMMAGMIIALNPEKYGFKNNPKPTWEWDEVTLDRSFELESLSKLAGISTKELRQYNPELRRWVTPPDVKEYVLRVPKGKGKKIAAKLEDIPEATNQPQFITHRVRKGQNLSYIARKYGTSISAIAAANNLRNKHRLQIGQTLRIPTNQYYSTSYAKPSGEYVIHTVKKGETLSQIAESYGAGLSVVRSWNNLYGKRFIYPGQKLKIPSSNAKPKVIATEDGKQKIIHTVRKNETLISIAKRYHVWVSNIRSWNNIQGSTIYVGQKIVIYKTAS